MGSKLKKTALVQNMLRASEIQNINLSLSNQQNQIDAS
jgi:hypothetical protein